MNTGKLDGALAYLSGSIEFAADGGIGWRRKFITLSRAAGLKIYYVDPTNKPLEQEIDIDENKAHQEILQRTGRFVELKEFVKKYRHEDLRFVDYSDFLVIVVDPDIPQWGTAHECYQAEDDHKPMFFVCPGGLYKLPRWLFGVADLDCVFETSEEVIDRLVKLNSGELPLSDDWVLIRRHVENQYRQIIM